LFPGDAIEVATFNEGVKVTSIVLLTSEIPYNKGRGFEYYLDAVEALITRLEEKVIHHLPERTS
jgi:hypothetical protein